MLRPLLPVGVFVFCPLSLGERVGVRVWDCR